MRKSYLILILMICAAAATNVFADIVIDSINPTLTPAAGYWSANYVAWEYSPGITYTLTDVESKFSSDGNSGTLGVAIYSEFASGPTGLLGSSTMFANNSDDWSTSYFSPISLTAGHTYYIVFSGTSGVGVNVNGTGPGTLTPYYFSYDNSNWYYWNASYGMFQFSGTPSIPEPSSIVLLGSGLLGMAGVIRRKLCP